MAQGPSAVQQHELALVADLPFPPSPQSPQLQMIASLFQYAHAQAKPIPFRFTWIDRPQPGTCSVIMINPANPRPPSDGLRWPSQEETHQTINQPLNPGHPLFAICGPMLDLDVYTLTNGYSPPMTPHQPSPETHLTRIRRRFKLARTNLPPAEGGALQSVCLVWWGAVELAKSPPAPPQWAHEPIRIYPLPNLDNQFHYPLQRQAPAQQQQQPPPQQPMPARVPIPANQAAAALAYQQQAQGYSRQTISQSSLPAHLQQQMRGGQMTAQQMDMQRRMAQPQMLPPSQRPVPPMQPMARAPMPQHPSQLQHPVPAAPPRMVPPSAPPLTVDLMDARDTESTRGQAAQRYVRNHVLLASIFDSLTVAQLNKQAQDVHPVPTAEDVEAEKRKLTEQLDALRKETVAMDQAHRQRMKSGGRRV